MCELGKERKDNKMNQTQTKPLDVLLQNIKNSSGSEKDLVCKYFHYFKKCAEALFYEYVIIIRSSQDRIIKIKPIEIEFYLTKCGIFEDPYIHNDPIQKRLGKLYVHKMPEHRAGIDITFGDEVSSIYGGILIKSAVINEEIIFGQTNVLKKIKEFVSTEHSGLTKNGTKWHNYLQNELDNMSVYLEEASPINVIGNIVTYSGRVGIADKKDLLLNEYKIEEYMKAVAPYRFVKYDFHHGSKNKLKMKNDLNYLWKIVNGEIDIRYLSSDPKKVFDRYKVLLGCLHEK